MRRHAKDEAIDRHDWDARAQEALDEAGKMPQGPARTEAMKKAGQLRMAAELKELLTTRPSKSEKTR